MTMKMKSAFPSRAFVIRALFLALILMGFALIEVSLYTVILGKSIHIYEKFLPPINYALWVGVVPFVYASLRKYPFQPPYWYSLGRHLIIAAMLLIIHSALVDVTVSAVLYFFDSKFAATLVPWSSWKVFFIRVLGGSLSNGILYFLTLASLMAFLTYQQYKEELIRRTSAEQKKSEAELRALKMQLHPHFFFNTLHCLSGLIEESATEAQDYVGRLGDVYRYTLEHSDQDLVPLRSEFDFVENYLSIQAIRFRDRLKTEIQVQPETLELLVPSFMLQPLIENAIKHGVSQSLAASHISVAACIDKGQLRISVTNSVDPQTPPNTGPGLGLKSIQSRLALLYDDDYHLSFESKDQMFVVEMALPLQRSGSDV